MSEEFTATFYDEDRKTILEQQKVKKGESVSYQGKIPEKMAENGIQYTFVGWETTGNVGRIMEDVELFAQYEESSKIANKEEDTILELVETNTETANLKEVMQAGQKVIEAEKITREMTEQQKKDLVAKVMDKGSVDLDKQAENERD